MSPMLTKQTSGVGKPRNKCRTHTIELMAAFEKKSTQWVSEYLSVNAHTVEQMCEEKY